MTTGPRKNWPWMHLHGSWNTVLKVDIYAISNSFFFFRVPIIVLYAEFLLLPSDCRKEKTTNQAWKQFCSPAAGCKWRRQMAITPPPRRSKIKICIFRLRGHSGCERRHGQTFSWLATIFKMSGKVMAYLSEAALLS